MSATTKLADDDDHHLDAVFHALADRTRRKLLTRLCAGPQRITDLAEPFEMSLVAVSKHIRVLERAGLIVRSIDGRVHRCSLEPAPLRDVEQWLSHYQTFWTDSLQALADYVETER